MIYNTQAFRHDPENGSYGDCYRTCLSCLLDLPRDDVPNFGVFYNDPNKFIEEAAKWLKTQNLVACNFIYTTLDDIYLTMSNVNKGVLYLIIGMSKSGYQHVVVACNDKIIWDPNPDKVGIVGPCTDGNYWVEILVPSCLTKTESSNLISTAETPFRLHGVNSYAC